MDDVTENIREALASLDTLDDDLWTADGAPKVEAVSKAADMDLKRADLINAAPKFSRSNADLSTGEDEPESEPEPEVNTQGYNHPEIVSAQEAYDEAVSEKAVAIAKEKRLSEKLAEVTDRLMRVPQDKLKNQRSIMSVIESSTKARAARVAQFNANRALVTDAIPRSALDQAKQTKKSVRPLMNK